MSAAYAPFADNPFASRADAQRFVHDLVEPLVPSFSPGRARVRISEDAGNFDRVASELEGFARPLWGIAPLLAGGGSFQHLDPYLEGLANGVNPQHREYWGKVGDYDQRAVEMAAIGYALAIAPQAFWEPLPASAKANLAQWLKGVERVTVHDDNWHFFVVLVQLGLARVGVPIDEAVKQQHLDRINDFYLGDGWYGDGPGGFVDHYNGYALHCYGLLYASLCRNSDRLRSDTYIERAHRFAAQYRYWFGDDGASIPFGRSMTYRFGMAGVWAAFALAGVEALPWAEIRGLWARHVRWWLNQPMTDALGRLAIGYRTPNLLMGEQYNSGTSSYWGMKALLPLSLPETHPFWAAAEAPAPASLPPSITSSAARFIAHRASGHAVLLPGGVTVDSVRNAPDKYAKFAYSSAFGFSVESDRWLHLGFAGDSTLALSPDRRHWRVRETVREGRIDGDRLHTTWSPWDGCSIETVQFLLGDWEIRAHRIRTDRKYDSVESGFALPGRIAETMSDAVLRQAGAVSALLDIGAVREATVMPVMPNTSLMFPHASVPVLRTTIEPGETILIAAVYANPSNDALPAAPSTNEIFSKLGAAGFRATASNETAARSRPELLVNS